MDAKLSTLFVFGVLLMGADKCISLNLQKDSLCTGVEKAKCSEDCTQIVQCTEAGHEPIVIATCEKGKYCEQNVNDPASVPQCSAETPKCGGGSDIDVVECGAFGEFPHPTRCDVTVHCSRELKVTDICTCTKGYIDIARIGLPCIEDGGECPRKLVECNQVGELGTFPGSNDYCYTCWADDAGAKKIQVYFCPTKLNVKSLFFPSSKTKQCEEKPPDSSSSSSSTTTTTVK